MSISAKKELMDRPKYINRRMHDVQRREWRMISKNLVEGECDLVDIHGVAEIIKMSKSAVQVMIFDGDFPKASYRIGTKNAWKKELVQKWLTLGI